MRASANVLVDNTGRMLKGLVANLLSLCFLNNPSELLITTLFSIDVCINEDIAVKNKFDSAFLTE